VLRHLRRRRRTDHEGGKVLLVAHVHALLSPGTSGDPRGRRALQPDGRGRPPARLTGSFLS
jgi:hypothetical protein